VSKLDQWELEERMVELLPSQRAFVFAPEKFACIAGGYGSGKTRAGVLRGLILSAMVPGNQGIIGRFHGKDLEDSTKPVFFEVVPPTWIRSYNKQNNVVTLRNGSVIMFRHIHDANSKTGGKSRRVGANLGWFFIDQMEELELAHWNTMISRLRLPRSPKHFGFGAINPAGHDWNFDMFFKGVRPWEDLPGKYHQILRPSKNVLGVVVNSEENRRSNGGFVDDDYYDQMLRLYSKQWADRYVRCSFDDFSGRIYKDYFSGQEGDRYNPDRMSIHNITPFSIPKHWDLVVGIDVGGDPSPWAIMPHWIDEYGNVVVTRGLVKHSLKISEIAAWIKKNLPWNEQRTKFVIDYENKVAMLELAEHGIHSQPAQKEIFPGILRVSGYLHPMKGAPLPPWYFDTQPQWRIDRFRTAGSPRLFVTDDNIEWMKDFEGALWDDKKPNTPKKTDTNRFDVCDATRYAIMTRPIASELKPMPPDRSHLIVDPLTYKEWVKLDQRIADRMLLKRGGGSLREADVEEVTPVAPGTRNFEW
jgi:hypothetical protein